MHDDIKTRFTRYDITLAALIETDYRASDASVQDRAQTLWETYNYLQLLVDEGMDLATAHQEARQLYEAAIQEVRRGRRQPR